jgi:hypothetical protein
MPHGSENKVNSPENLLFNNCYLHYITHLVGKIAAILGHDAAAATYATDAERIATAVNKAYVGTKRLFNRLILGVKRLFRT